MPPGRLAIHTTSFPRTLLPSSRSLPPHATFKSSTTPTTAFQFRSQRSRRPPDRHRAGEHLVIPAGSNRAASSPARKKRACKRGTPTWQSVWRSDQPIIRGQLHPKRSTPPSQNQRTSPQKLAQHAPRFPPAARARARRRHADTVGPDCHPHPVDTSYQKLLTTFACGSTDMWG